LSRKPPLTCTLPTRLRAHPTPLQQGFGKLSAGGVAPVSVSLPSSAAPATGSAAAAATLVAQQPALASQSAMAAQPDAKLARLRQLMVAADGGKGVAAYIVPTEDPHMSEVRRGLG
jgi:hypothetical protein